MTNEKGEIRVCNLVATKSHSQFELALARMRQSLDLYGHRQPTLFYTDNMADKQFLEACFPSLREDVVPVDKYSHLDRLLLPEDVYVFVRETPQSIDQAILTIMDRQSNETGEIVVGFDVEWDVDLLRGPGRSQVAVIQIAFQKQIYIMRVCHILACCWIRANRSYRLVRCFLKAMHSRLTCVHSSPIQTYARLGA